MNLLALNLAFFGDLVDSPWFFVIGGLVLVGLLVLLFVMRNRREED